MAGVIDSAKAINPRAVLVDEAVADMERELGHLDLVRRIALERILAQFGRNYAHLEACENRDSW